MAAMRPTVGAGLVLLSAVCCSTVLICAQTATVQSDNAARSKLYGYIDSIARSQLNARRQALLQVRTRTAAERRRTEVRDKILKLIGGLPARSGVPAMKEFGTVSGDGFRMD